MLEPSEWLKIIAIISLVIALFLSILVILLKRNRSNNRTNIIFLLYFLIIVFSIFVLPIIVIIFIVIAEILESNGFLFVGLICLLITFILLIELEIFGLFLPQKKPSESKYATLPIIEEEDYDSITSTDFSHWDEWVK